MALTQIDFNEEEEVVIKKVSKEYKLNKSEAVRKIVASLIPKELL